MYEDGEKKELQKINTIVYPYPIDAANDIWTLYVKEPKEARTQRRYAVVDGWHHITALKQMMKDQEDLDIQPNIRIFDEIG